MYKYVKRFLDILFSIILIIVTLPIMLLTLLITYLNIGTPLIDIRLPREGTNKKPFYMYKIRTRVYDENGKSHYTKISRVIDILGLNEFPQLFNILKGEMSFIGPRPFICNEKLPDGEINPKRYLVRPGVMGLAQSLGGRTYPYSKTLECDEIYYDNMSFFKDVKIFFGSIVATIKCIIKDLK